ncbi:MAG: HAMP domain-containing sensor histidine kinase, partial [Spirosomataceae bacterium]
MTDFDRSDIKFNSLNLQFAAINHRPSKENLSKAEKLAAQMFDLIGNEPQLQRFRVSVLNSLVIYYTESGEGKKVCDTFKSILNASDPKEIPENYYGVMLNLSFICIDLKKNNEVKNRNGALSFENKVIRNKDRGIIIDLTVTGFLLALLAVSLYKSRKEAYLQTAEIQRLSAVRDQYIYIVAHDLRSPILAMQGMYDLINESIKKQRYDDLERISYYIDETGIKTTDLLDNLFMWGMSQREELAYEPVQLNVREEVNKALSVYEAIKILNNFSFSNDCPETTTVFADQDSLQLILRNLIDNAVKHLPSSRGQIDIDVVESTTENVCRLTVRENGVGIDSSQRAAIK